MSTTLSEDELFKLKQRHLTQSQRALIAAELATAKSGGHHSLGITMDVAAKQMGVGQIMYPWLER